MDASTLASFLRTRNPRSQKLRNRRPIPHDLEAVHPRWDALVLNNEPSFMLPEASLSDVSECSEHTGSDLAHAPGPRVVILQCPPWEIHAPRNACLSPSTTVWGSDDHDATTTLKVFPPARRRLSMITFLSHLAAGITQKLRNIGADRRSLRTSSRASVNCPEICKS